MSKKLLFCLIFLLILFSSVFALEVDITGTGEALQKNHVIVYYFYGNIRCSSCRRIEQYTREAVDKYFKKEIDSGRLVVTIINMEKPENKHFVENYQLYTKSVILSLNKNDKEIKNKNLEKVWQYLTDKDKFHDYVRNGIAGYLEEL